MKIKIKIQSLIAILITLIFACGMLGISIWLITLGVQQLQTLGPPNGIILITFWTMLLLLCSTFIVFNGICLSGIVKNLIKHRKQKQRYK